MSDQSVVPNIEHFPHDPKRFNTKPVNGGRLEDWEILPVMFTDGKALSGRVFDDIRFPDGTMISTSLLMYINHDEKTARTVNTTYVLGRPTDRS